jgi:hypothetical protein
MTSRSILNLSVISSLISKYGARAGSIRSAPSLSSILIKSALAMLLKQLRVISSPIKAVVKCLMFMRFYHACFLKRRDAKPIKPNAKIARVEGSGTAVIRFTMLSNSAARPVETTSSSSKNTPLLKNTLTY